MYAFDSTTIDLCLSVFEWANFRKHKGGMLMSEPPRYMQKLLTARRLRLSIWWIRCLMANKPLSPLMITLNVGLYTTNKLLGHKNIATISIYAKIINQKKDDAVNLVDEVFK